MKMRDSRTTNTLKSGTVTEYYSDTLKATGDEPITWEIVSATPLPDGLDLDAESGEISGTPTTDGTFTFTVKATNDVSYDTKELSIVIVPDVGIVETGRAPSLPRIYPNPTTGKVYLQTESNVRIYTIQGKLLQETFSKEIDLSPYAQGMYFLQIDEIWCKVVKQ